LDTSPEADAVRREILARMTYSQKAEQMSELSEAVRDLMIAGTRMRNPEYSESDARWATIRHLLGEDLFECAYPDAPRLAF